MKINGQGRPGVRTRRVTCTVCKRLVGAHKFGRGGGYRLASLHNDPTTNLRCVGSMQPGASP